MTNESETNLNLHPAVQIYIWICIAFIIQILDGLYLFAFAGLLLLLAFVQCKSQLIHIVKRTRWIMFSILLIYSYVTGGEAIWPELGFFSPILSGVTDGLIQIVRLLAVLASLTILLMRLSQVQLVSGLYTLVYPLSYLGLKRDKFAVRLALTLTYAEKLISDKKASWRNSMVSMLNPVHGMSGNINHQHNILSRRDWLICLAITLTLLGVIL